MQFHKAMIPLGDGHTLSMKFTMPDEELDLDQLLRVDLHNLAAEIVTIPIALNKFGILLADATHSENVKKLERYTMEAKTRDALRAEHASKKMKAPTVQDLEDATILNKTCNTFRKRYYEQIKIKEYINNVYWALKSKDEKIKLLSTGLQAGDVLEQLVNTQIRRINCVDLRVIKPVIE